MFVIKLALHFRRGALREHFSTAMEFKSGKVKVSFAQVMIAVGGKMTALGFIEFLSSLPFAFMAGQTMEGTRDHKLLHVLYMHSIQL